MTRAADADVARVGASFRDPAGFVYERDGVLLRQVSRSFAATYDRVRDSGLYDRLIADRLLVPHVEVDTELAATPDAHRVLRPERIPLLSHPYEWCPGQRRDAALTTLRIQEIALDHGMTLRDASAYNVQFRGGRPVFIDTLSFEPVTPGRPWVAYRQFCEQFLAPLALEVLVDVRLGRRLLVADVGGVPLDLAAGLLPGRTRLRPGLALHLHGQARASARSVPDGPARTARHSDTAVRGLVDNLAATVRRLTWDDPSGPWADYYDEATHYDDDAMTAKIEIVDAWLGRTTPAAVWDLGANTGRFSDLAARHGAVVGAFDVDAAAVERAWQRARSADDPDGAPLPLVLDLTNPSPAVGWANRERPSLAQRGPVDVVLALALVHHLAIGGNVPFGLLAEHLAELGRTVVVEWVPKDDPMVEVLLRTREDVFADHTHAAFTRALGARFDELDRADLPGSGRILHLMRQR